MLNHIAGLGPDAKGVMPVSLTDRRILVVEDQFILAQHLCDSLTEAGVTVVGPEPSVEAALARIEVEERIDAAILDVNLGNETVFAVANVLSDQNVPILFASGYGSEAFTSRFSSAINCSKPLNMRSVLKALSRLLGQPRR